MVQLESETTNAFILSSLFWRNAREQRDRTNRELIQAAPASSEKGTRAAGEFLRLCHIGQTRVKVGAERSGQTKD
jgi:hypothetical protein